MKKIAILFSGNGSNLEAIVRALDKEIEIAVAITNNKDAYGVKRCEYLGVECQIIPHSEYESREDFEKSISIILDKKGVDLVVLAGFMRILTPYFVKRYKCVNIHPSILPLFKGANALKESYESNMTIAGVSVHFVNEELDGGEIVVQEVIDRVRGESFESFKEKIHALEHDLYPRAIRDILK